MAVKKHSIQDETVKKNIKLLIGSKDDIMCFIRVHLNGVERWGNLKSLCNFGFQSLKYIIFTLFGMF